MVKNVLETTLNFVHYTRDSSITCSTKARVLAAMSCVLAAICQCLHREKCVREGGGVSFLVVSVTTQKWQRERTRWVTG